MLKRVLMIACVMLAMMICNGAQAATVIYYDAPSPNLIAEQISGLEYSGVTYDVTFEKRPYSLQPFEFSTEAQAIGVSTLIRDLLNSGTAEQVGDGAGTNDDDIYVTWATGAEVLGAVRSQWKLDQGGWYKYDKNDGPPESTTLENYTAAGLGTTNRMYAEFTTSQVPIPGAVWLLGSGLIGMVGIRRKFKK